MITAIEVFDQNAAPMLGEVWWAIKPGGSLILEAVDRASPIGQMYEANKTTDTFYREAYLASVSRRK